MLTPLAGGIPERMTLTERSNRHNPVREDGSVSSAVPPALCGEQKPGCRDGVPAGLGVCEGEGKAHPLQIFRKKNFREKSTNYNMQNRPLIDCLITLLDYPLDYPLDYGG